MEATLVEKIYLPDHLTTLVFRGKDGGRRFSAEITVAMKEAFRFPRGEGFDLLVDMGEMEVLNEENDWEPIGRIVR